MKVQQCCFVEGMKHQALDSHIPQLGFRQSMALDCLVERLGFLLVVVVVALLAAVAGVVVVGSLLVVEVVW